jgi:hypothetical protein
MIFYPPLLKRGICLMPSLILIPQWAREDYPYHQHEQVHAAQQRVGGVLTFWWCYLTDKAFRQQAEVEAYKVQISYGAKHSSCARHLSTGYWLNLDYNTAYNLLKD